jgi:4-amino-4-deoxy-L-arabinose transferase-like glycosyltransferase
MKLSHISKYRFIISTSILFCIFLFFRFYQLEQRAIFGWDQVNNAWAALRILTERNYPLIGFESKGNSGMYIGPLYYYFISIFYWCTHLNPIASPMVAGFTSIVSFFVLLTVSKKLFQEQVATIALIIYTFSEFIIGSQRIQGPVSFIPPLSLVILYFLYQVLLGKWIYLIYLSIAVGLSFHIHFTSIFYLFIIALALPIIPYTKKMWKYVIWSTVIFISFFIPQIIYYVSTRNSGSLTNYSTYFQNYFHGLHLRRCIQISYDAFIQFESVLKPFRFLRPTVFFYLPAFMLLYSYTNTFKKSWKLLYLFALWFIIPWLVLATYSGEITDYYFFNSQYIAILILAYLTTWLINRKHFLITLTVGVFWLVYIYSNVQAFFKPNDGNLQGNKLKVQQMIKEGKMIDFAEGDPQSYLFYIYTHK